jgi:hypothetical protein
MQVTVCDVERKGQKSERLVLDIKIVDEKVGNLERQKWVNNVD